jgi:putative transposase
MTSKSGALLLADLGVTKTPSRPYVSAHNPYAEAPCTALQSRPGFPDRLGSRAEARRFCQEFFSWYNHEHHHSGLPRLTPAAVPYGTAAELLAHRHAVLDAAYQAHPERCVKPPPQHPGLPEAVGMNPPVAKQDQTP